MSDMPLECLQSHHEFRSIRDDWDEFMDRCFPENYARTHAMLSVFWETYHAGHQALIYIQRAAAGGKIVAAAPLIVKNENFGGFRVRMLQSLGRGLGCDDFLIGPDAVQTVRAVLADLRSRRTWDVTSLRRVSPSFFLDELISISREKKYPVDFSATSDYLVTLPKSYGDYLASRSSKFRNNLMHANKRLQASGAVSIERLSPFTQADRALALCEEVARQSWQFKAGKSHFNEKGSSCFYSNLVQNGRWAGGEEFVVLLVDNKPVAFMLGCKRGRTYYLIDTAYNEEFRHVSVGRVLFSKTIEHLIESGDVDRFNLEGDGEYKDYYANETREVQSITMYNNSLYGRCISFLRRTSLYDKLKKIRDRKNDSTGS
jgi:CelD/BcsL family acetyltransferase involved in cellulose biosynthesis